MRSVLALARPRLTLMSYAASRRALAAYALPHYRVARRDFEDPAHDAKGRASQFPWIDAFELEKEGHLYTASQIVASLEPILSQDRVERIDSVIESRCFQVLPLVENPHDWGNVSAVCRSADALGFGAVHIIRDKQNEKYKQSARTAGGSDKWLDIQLHDCSTPAQTRAVLTDLKRRGFRIVATALGTADKISKTPTEIDWTRPTVAVFGNELEGVSPTVMDVADDYCEIPIDGFVESYNVSVAASLVFWEARRVRLEKLGKHGDLDERERDVLRAVYYLRNKGQFVSYASQLLRRSPPRWQQERNLDWGDKEMDMDRYVDGKYVRKLKAKNVVCHLWDGEVCLGERHLYKERTCRYRRAHHPGQNTLDLDKLREQARRYQVEHRIPKLLQELDEAQER